MANRQAPDDGSTEPSRPRTVFEGFRKPTPPPIDRAEDAPQGKSSQLDEIKIRPLNGWWWRRRRPRRRPSSQPNESESGTIAYEIGPLDEEAAQLETAVAQEPLSGVEEPSWRPFWQTIKPSRLIRLVVKAYLLAAPFGLMFGLAGLCSSAGNRHMDVILSILFVTSVVAVIILVPLIMFTDLDR